MRDVWLLFLWLNFLIWLACGVVTALKAKPGMLVLGVILPVWYFSAARLGKPSSVWAKKFYGAEKMRRASRRYDALLTSHDVERLRV